MPRKSVAALSVIPVDGPSPRVHPPATLDKREREVFIELVNAADSRHFRESDLPLLVAYVQAIVLADKAAAELRKGAVLKGKASPWLSIQERAIKHMVALSMRLRLSPQARGPNLPSRPNPSKAPLSSRLWE
jgi:phage terminase small subunit